jgi:hypothetical protein
MAPIDEAHFIALWHQGLKTAGIAARLGLPQGSIVLRRETRRIQQVLIMMVSLVSLFQHANSGLRAALSCTSEGKDARPLADPLLGRDSGLIVLKPQYGTQGNDHPSGARCPSIMHHADAPADATR